MINNTAAISAFNIHAVLCGSPVCGSRPSGMAASVASGVGYWDNGGISSTVVSAVGVGG